MPVDPHGVTAAVVAQQRQVTGALLGNQNIAVRQHQQTPRVDQAGRERCCREARRHLWGLPGILHNQHPVGDDRPCLRRWQIGRVDTETPAQLVLFQKILLQVVLLLVILDARRLGAGHASLRIERCKRKRANRQRGARNRYGSDKSGSEMSHRVGSLLQDRLTAIDRNISAGSTLHHNVRQPHITSRRRDSRLRCAQVGNRRHNRQGATGWARRKAPRHYNSRTPRREATTTGLRRLQQVSPQ